MPDFSFRQHHLIVVNNPPYFHGKFPFLGRFDFEPTRNISPKINLITQMNTSNQVQLDPNLDPLNFSGSIPGPNPNRLASKCVDIRMRNGVVVFGVLNYGILIFCLGEIAISFCCLLVFLFVFVKYVQSILHFQSEPCNLLLISYIEHVDSILIECNLYPLCL